MNILVLYNSLDRESRVFAELDGEGYASLDWYANDEGRRAYLAAGHPSPSAFPTVVDLDTNETVSKPLRMIQAISVLQNHHSYKTLDMLISSKLKAIDDKTADILEKGFPFKGHRFSLAQDALMNLMALLPVKDTLPYPFPWSDVDNVSAAIDNATEFAQFYGAMVAFAMGSKAQAVPLRAAVAGIKNHPSYSDAEKKAALELLEDTRV
jgi:hypothetical protein